jgi:hypothetical protein
VHHDFCSQVPLTLRAEFCHFLEAASLSHMICLQHTPKTGLNIFVEVHFVLLKKGEYHSFVQESHKFFDGRISTIIFTLESLKEIKKTVIIDYDYVSCPKSSTKSDSQFKQEMTGPWFIFCANIVRVITFSR